MMHNLKIFLAHLSHKTVTTRDSKQIGDAWIHFDICFFGAVIYLFNSMPSVCGQRTCSAQSKAWLVN